MASNGRRNETTYFLKSEFFECSICNEEWLRKEPRILPCQHTFCTECLLKLYNYSKQTTTLTCPNCRQTINWPKNGINGFHRNLVANNILKIEKESKPIKICSMHNSEILFVCRKCSNNFICIECWKDHSVHDLIYYEEFLYEKYKENCNGLIENAKSHLEVFYCTANSDAAEVEKILIDFIKRFREEIQKSNEKMFKSKIEELNDIKYNLDKSKNLLKYPTVMDDIVQNLNFFLLESSVIDSKKSERRLTVDQINYYIKKTFNNTLKKRPTFNKYTSRLTDVADQIKNPGETSNERCNGKINSSNDPSRDVDYQYDNSNDDSESIGDDSQV